MIDVRPPRPEDHPPDHPITQGEHHRMNQYSRICQLRQEADRLEEDGRARLLAADHKKRYDAWMGGYTSILDPELRNEIAKLSARIDQIEASFAELIDERIRAHERKAVQQATRWVTE